MRHAIARPTIGFLVVMLSLLAGLMPAAVPSVALATAPSGAPGSLVPSTGSLIDGNPIFAWTATTGAVRYRVQVSTAVDFSTTAFSVDTSELRATPTADLPKGQLYWRVAGMDAGGSLGPWASSDFTRQWGAPTPSYPADAATLAFPADALRFDWSSLRGADYYQLEVDDASDFVGASTYNTKNTSYVITEPRTYGQVVYWHVRGVSATGGVVSSWSATRSFTTTWPGVPTLVYPADNAVVDAKSGDLYFDWSPVLGARTYQLQVSPNADWANNRTIDEQVKGTRYASPTTLNNGNYYWRVRALDAAGTQNYGPWSAVRVVQRSWSTRPELVSPLNGNTSVSDPVFVWTAIDHAAWYWLQVGTDVNFGPSTYADCFTNRTSWAPYFNQAGIGLSEPGGCGINLTPGVTYYWHVRGVDGPVMNAGIEYGGGVLGLWSNTSDADVFSFVYQPDSPTRVSPADLSTVTVPTLTWNNALGAARYRPVIVRMSDGATVAATDTYSTSWTPTGLLTAPGLYRWYVLAYDSNGHSSLIPSVGSQWTFTLNPITTTFASPDPVSPANLAPSTGMPSLEWQPVTGATSYHVFYGVNGSNVEFDLSGGIPYPAFTYSSSILSPGTYWWYVKAYNGSGVEIANSLASQRTFVISQLDVLAAGSYLTPAKCSTPPLCTPVADTATLTWAPIPGALWYRVYVALDPNFTNVYRSYDTWFPRLTPRDSWRDNQANQAYYWFVRPFRSGNSGRFDSQAQQNASAYLKRSEAVHLGSPADAAAVADEITFTWEDFLTSNQGLTPKVNQEAKQYRIQVSTVSDFATIYDDRTVDQTSYTVFDRTYPEGPLYWRVAAIDGSNNDLTWSLPADLGTNRPNLVTKASPTVVLVSPAAGSTQTGLPAFTWTPQAFAASYEIELSRNGDTNFASENQVIRTTTKMAGYSYPEALAAGDYAWRVRRHDADDRVGPWSAGIAFHLNPGAPSLISPANGATVGTAAASALVFQWSSTQGYPRYLLETSTSAGFGSTVESRSTVMTSWAPTSVYPDGTYYWRVKALNAAGAVVATSGVYSMTVDTTTPAVPAATSVALSGSGSISGSFVVTFNKAVKGIAADTYTVEVASSGVPVAGTLTPASAATLGTTATFKPSTPLVPGESYKLKLMAGITDGTDTPLVPASYIIRTALAVENGSVAFKETWPRIASASASGGGYAASRQAGATESVTFDGTSVSILGMRGKAGGRADVYIDGVKVTATPISFYAATTAWKATVWSTSSLAAGTHTIKLRALGTKVTAATGTWTWFDAFVAGATTYEENAASVVARFPTVTSASAYGGSYDTIARAYGEGGAPVYSMVFKGTGVVVYATKTATSGSVAIYIDGVLKKTVALYSSTTKYKQAVWTSATLTSATHTITVRVIGATTSTSTKRNVSIDRFLVK